MKPRSLHASPSAAALASRRAGRGRPGQAARVQAALDGWLAERAPGRGGDRHRRLRQLRRARPRDRGLRRQGRPRARRPAGRARHPLRHGQHLEVLRRRRHPEARGRGAPLPRRHPGQMAPRIPRLGRGQHPPPAQHDQRHPQLLRDRGDVAHLGRGERARLHRRGAGGARLPDRRQRPAGHQRLSLLQHQLPPRRHDRRQGGRQALSPTLVRGADPRAPGPPRHLLQPRHLPARARRAAWRTATSRTPPAPSTSRPTAPRPGTSRSIGRDVRGDSTSWAQAAGGAIATARDVDSWMRAVFAGRVVPPEQQAEWLALVSTRTGEPIADVSPEDPQGFALGLVKAFLAPYGGVWFYQGDDPRLPHPLRLVRGRGHPDHRPDQQPARRRPRTASRTPSSPSTTAGR